MSTVVQDAVYDFRTNFQNTVFGSVRPSVNAYNRIKSLRQPIPKHELERFLEWDADKKEGLLELLTNLVAVPYNYEDFTNWLEEIEGKLEESEEFKDFYNLRGQFDRLKLDLHQKQRLVKEAIINLETYVNMFISKITRTMEITDDDSEIEELFVTGSLLRTISKILESFRKSEKLELLNVTSILILRFAAYTKGKIPIEELMVDISESKKYVKENILSDEEFKAIYWG